MNTTEKKKDLKQKIWTELKITVRTSKMSVEQLNKVLEEGRRLKASAKHNFKYM